MKISGNGKGRGSKMSLNPTNRGMIAKSSFTVPVGLTNPSGILYIVNRVTPTTPGVTPSTVFNIAAAYEFFRVRSFTIEYVPTGGMNYMGDGQVGFIDNPELMAAAVGGSDSTKSSILTNSQGVRAFGLNQPFTKTWDQASRLQSRKWYSTNYTASAGTDDYDRSVPTLMIMRFDTGFINSQVLGKLTFHVTFEFNSLGNTGPYTLMDRSAARGEESTEEPPTPICFYHLPGEPWPEKVLLKAGSSGNRVYAAVKEEGVQ